MQNGIAKCKKSDNTRDRQMVYKCRLLYARGLSRREENREMNGVVDQLAKKLRVFLAACGGSLESKVRGCILQYFNPMVALSAQVYIKPVNKPVEETSCVAKRTAKTKTSASQKNGNEEYKLQLALLRLQMTGMQQQVPFIAHRLQAFCQSLALAESALRGKQLDLTFRKGGISKQILKKKDIDNKSMASLAEISRSIQTPISHGLAIPGVPSHILFNGGPSSHRPSLSSKRTTGFAAGVSKLATGHNIALKKAPPTAPVVPIFPDGMLNTSVPKIIGLPPRTLASISNNVVTSGGHHIWNQGVTGLPKLAPRAPGATVTFRSPHQLPGTSFASPSSPSKTSPRSRPRKSISRTPPVAAKVAFVSPRSRNGFHLDMVATTKSVTDSISTGPKKRVRSDEGLQGNCQVRRPRVELSNGYGKSIAHHSRSSVRSR